MLAIIIMEFKGFTRIAEELAKNMDEISLNAERIRAASIDIINETITETKKVESYLSVEKIGGDTWFFKFRELEDAIKYGCLLLKNFMGLANEKGVYYLKPSIAVNIGEPRTSEGNFLDDMSITTYGIADKGMPYKMYIVNDAINQAKSLPWVETIDIAVEPKNNTTNEIKCIKWIASANNLGINESKIDFSLPSLLLDGEVIYSKSASDGFENIISQQDRSNSVLAFGGPVSIQTRYFSNYIGKTIQKLKSKSNFKIYVLSYILLDEPLNSFTWLELCKRLSIKYPKKFYYTAFIIEKGQLRPFSYHIYDDKIVHIGLRTYSPERGTPAMSSAIMIRNKEIALRFKDEFLENWRSTGVIDELKHASIVVKIKGLSDDLKKKAYEIIEKIL